MAHLFEGQNCFINAKDCAELANLPAGAAACTFLLINKGNRDRNRITALKVGF
jgi:hypothetical protein